MSKLLRGVTIDAVPTGSIAAASWDEIWELTRAFYDAERGYVEQRLREHQRIVLFRSRSERALVGMASLDVYPVSFRGRKLAVIYTSHVLLEERYRGHNLIQRVGFRTFLEARLRFPLRPLYWFFDTFSYKSYLLLPRNFRDFWPRFDRRTPEWEAALIDHLAARTYGPAWQPAAGIVARSGQKRLREPAAPLAADGIPGEDVGYFARVNPGHAEGDMLVCLCPLSLRNWLSLGGKALLRHRRRLAD
ncbi:MAG TPA: hypothetical protein VFP37_03890 [Steroidobacteraceae bacterium]|nr:hypothetical protein [Steroidobacteraceae bacterium]